MEELIKRKDYLLKMCQLLYKEFIMNENVYVDDLSTDPWLYERVFEFIDNKLGHKDTDISDFIYACFYENSNEYGEDIFNISSKDVIVPRLKKLKAKRSYMASVRFQEIYTFDSYMNVIMEYAINNYQIDYDDFTSDIHDTWDENIDVWE
jgi:hypothetical protein